jgi:hypothetical protein
VCAGVFTLARWSHSCLHCTRLVCSNCKGTQRFALADGRMKKACVLCAKGKAAEGKTGEAEEAKK